MELRAYNLRVMSLSGRAYLASTMRKLLDHRRDKPSKPSLPIDSLIKAADLSDDDIIADLITYLLFAFPNTASRE